MKYLWGRRVSYLGGIDSYTKLLIHANEADGTAGTDIIDSELTPKTITAAGNAQVDTAQAKFGTGSILFDGTDDGLSLDDHADWNFGTGNFTIDFHVRFNSLTADQCFASQYEDGINYWALRKTSHASDDKLVMTFMDGGAAKGSYIMTNAWSGITANTWYHLAFVRSGTGAKIFMDGVSQTLSEIGAFGANDVGDIAGNLYIGLYDGTNDFNGWIDEFRISKGIARWTADFSPPTSAYTITTIS